MSESNHISIEGPDWYQERFQRSYTDFVFNQFLELSEREMKINPSNKNATNITITGLNSHFTSAALESMGFTTRDEVISELFKQNNMTTMNSEQFYYFVNNNAAVNNPNQIVMELFSLLDPTSSGLVQVSQLFQLLESLDINWIPKEDLDIMINQFDKENKQALTKDEFFEIFDLSPA